MQNSLTIHKIERFLISGIAIYAFSFLNNGMTALSSIGICMAIICWLTKHIMTRGTNLVYSKHLLVSFVIALGIITLISCLYSPDPMRSLRSYCKLDNFGRAIVLAVIIAEISNPRYQKIIVYAILGGACIANAQHLLEWIQAGIQYSSFLPPVEHFAILRNHAFPIAFFLPFIWYACQDLTRRRYVLACQVWLLLQLILLFSTGSRGAWVSALIVLLLTTWLFKYKNLLLKGVVLTCVFIGALQIYLPNNIVSHKISAGFDTTHRTDGTWGPTLDMIKKKPFLGYGYGRWVYHNEYSKQLPEHSDWYFKKPPQSPHNIFLTVWFFSGIISLVLLLSIFILLIWHLLHFIYQHSCNDPQKRAFAICLLSSIVSYGIGLGMVETLRWEPLGVLWGLSIGFVLSIQQVNNPKKISRS